MAVNKNTLYYVANYQCIPVLYFNNPNQADFACTEVALPILISSWKIHISCMNPAESIWWTICVRIHKNYTPSVVSFLLRLPTLSSLYYLTIFLPCGLSTFAFIPHWHHISNFQSTFLIFERNWFMHLIYATCNPLRK